MSISSCHEGGTGSRPSRVSKPSRRSERYCRKPSLPCSPSVTTSIPPRPAGATTSETATAYERLEGSRRRRGVLVARSHRVEQLVRAREAADVRGEDAVFAALHALTPCRVAVCRASPTTMRSIALRGRPRPARRACSQRDRLGPRLQQMDLRAAPSGPGPMAHSTSIGAAEGLLDAACRAWRGRRPPRRSGTARTPAAASSSHAPYGARGRIEAVGEAPCARSSARASRT